MKRIIYYTLCVLGFTCSIQSCDDFLDAFPTDQVTNENYWKTPDDAEKLLVDLYTSMMPKSGIFWDEAMSDNAYLCWEWWGGQQQLANGTYTTSGDVPIGKWSGCYSNIRKCWFLLEGLEKVQFNSEVDKKRIMGETYFMLAYNYQLLTSFFGDVPLVTKVLNIDESKTLVRTPKAQVVDFAEQKLSEAISLLAGITQENGKITADACRCLLARLQLYNGDYQGVLETVKDLEGKYQLYTAGETPYEDLFSGAAGANRQLFGGAFVHVGQIPLHAVLRGGWMPVPRRSLFRKQLFLLSAVKRRRRSRRRAGRGKAAFLRAEQQLLPGRPE